MRMKMKYRLPVSTSAERALFEYLLMEELAKQQWYSVVRLGLWQTEGLIMIQ
ncbi:MAG TPA: hypothetical protein VMW43_07765 [Bacteroidota bacterium]|nr:hypothetical protein [Bacteroidota bacterium]